MKKLNKFLEQIKNNSFNDPHFRMVMKQSYTKEQVSEFVNFLDVKYSIHIRYAVFELLAKSGYNPIELFEKYFKSESNTSVPGKIIDFASKNQDADLILAVHSNYPSLSTMALMKLKKMKKYDFIAPFLLSDNVSLANLASDILNNSED